MSVKTEKTFAFVNGSEKVAEVHPQQLALSLQSIALYFDATETQRGRDGTLRRYNPLAYLQKRVLQGLCWSLTDMVRGSERTLVKAKADAKQAGREFQNDEISLEALEKAMGWVERLEDQIVHAKAALDVAMQAHAFYVGSGYVFPERENEVSAATVQPTPPTPNRKAEALERLRRLGLVEEETAAARTNGVATTAQDAALAQGGLAAGGEVGKAPAGIVTVQGEAKLVKKDQLQLKGNGSAA